MVLFFGEAVEVYIEETVARLLGLDDGQLLLERSRGVVVAVAEQLFESEDLYVRDEILSRDS